METSSADDRGQRQIAQHEYNKAVKRHFPYNAAFLIALEFVWGLSLPFALIFTVIPAYLTELNAPKALIGLIAPLYITLCPLQVLISHYFTNRKRKVWLAYSYMLSVIPWLLYNIIFFVFPGCVSPAVQLTLFCLCMVFFLGACVGNFPVYFSLITDCTPRKKRGSLFGYRITALAFAVLLMAMPARWVMKNWADPQNFHIAFIIGNLFQFLTGLTFLTIKEQRDPSTVTNNNHSMLNRMIPKTRLAMRKMLRNPNYQVFIFFIALFSVSMALGPFIVVFAKESLNLQGSNILTFTIMQMTSAAIFNVCLGKLADRFGYRIIGILQGLLLTAGFVAVFIASLYRPICIPIVYLGFFLYAGVTTVSGMVMMNMSIELLPKQNSATIISLGNMLITPSILIAVPLSGLIIDLSGNYSIIFLLGAAFVMISTFGFALLVREPRKRKMYVVKYIRRL